MTGAELRRIRKRLGLTQLAMAEKIGVHANSLARWERDVVRITEPVARLIRLLGTQPRR
jgi:transcriptional regulator with XRE-family HTH domain